MNLSRGRGKVVTCQTNVRTLHSRVEKRRSDRCVAKTLEITKATYLQNVIFYSMFEINLT